jgi:hypothetical protein
MTYVGSVSQPVPLVLAETWAYKYHSNSYFSTESITNVGSSDNPVPSVVAETHGTAIVTKVRAESVVQDTTSMTITTTQEAGAAITVANTAVNLFTHNLGTQEVLNLGPVVFTATAAAGVITMVAAMEVETLTAASAVSGTYIVAPDITVVNVGLQHTVNVPEDTTISTLTSRVTATESRVNALHSILASSVAATSSITNNVSGNETGLSMSRLYLDTDLMLLNSMSLLGA